MDKYIGKLLDNRYEILEVTGTGGMAVVYKALCHRLNRFVAVKILKDEFVKDAEFRRRFYDESQAVAMLSHPNIVSVFDVSNVGPLEYIVMELIDGITLKEYLKQKGRLNWKETLFFVSQIAKALSHAHGRGIIHRDIKPQNMLILRDGTLKVTDFGIARLIMQNQQSLTQDALGSVHYVAPEQAKGSHIDARADIYSLGVIMYEMLTGRLPFEGETPVAVAIQHINAIPLMPREINPEIPKALESITMKAMNPSLNNRYSSADELLDDLEKFKNNPKIVIDYDKDESADLYENEDTRKLKSYNMADMNNRELKRNADLSDGIERRGALANKNHSYSTGRLRKNYNEYYEDEEKKSSHKMGPSLIVGIIAVAVFVIGAIFFIQTIFNSDTGTDTETVTAPKLVGRMLSDVQADQDLKDKGFVIKVLKEEPSDEYEAGYIISQDPESNASMKPTDVINVVVSSGSKKTELSDYTNKEFREVESELTNLGIPYKEEYEKSDDILEGYIIRTSPGKGTMVSKDDTVILTISQGAEISKVVVPDVLGFKQSDAISAIEKAGLSLEDIKQTESDKTPGIILWQSLKPKTEVDEKTSIVLEVSIPKANSDGQTGSDNNQTDNTGNGNGSSNNNSGTKQTKTVPITVTLPETPDKVRVTVKLNGDTIYDKEHKTSEKTVSVPVTSSGTGLVTTFVDNVLTGEQVVNFT